MAVMAAEGDPGLVHRRISEGPLDVHPTQSAIVVNYVVEAVVISEYGEPMVADRKECTKVVNVKNLSVSTDVQALARQIVSQCSQIQPSRLPEVEQLLLYLQTRAGDKWDKDVLEDSSKKLQKQIEDLEVPSEQATMAELDSYLECLYEELPAKVRGTGLILQLARTPDNLLELANNESLFLALARVLREDWKKSIDLSTNISYIFFCFSTFSDFHRTLVKHKIGSMCMTIVAHEMKRHKSLLEDLGKRKRDAKSDSASTAKREYEKAKKKCQQLLKKQETLLRVTLYLLLNLAEDTRVEQKMRNRSLVLQLSTLLDRENHELLILVVSFLKKLSIFRENKDEMATAGVIKKLARVIPCDNEILVNVSLRLLLNLSFDPALRQELVKVGLLPKLVAFLSSETHCVIVLCILYHVSMDEKSRGVFAYTDCIPQVMKIILECPDELVEPEVIALGINLALHPGTAQLMCQGPGLKLLMRRALKTQDSLLMKMVRNLSQHPGPTKKLFLGFISELGGALKSCEEEEFTVEVLGILGNLSFPEIDFEKVVRELDLLPFISLKLKDPSVKDDILLEVINLCGTFSLDEKCAGLLVQAKLTDLLVTLLKAKQEDDELVLQIVYVFHQLVLHDSTRQSLTKESQAADYLLELMNDKNREICKLCSEILDIIAEYDADLARKIQCERFRWHNFQWLEMMTGETLYEEEEQDEDYLDPSYLHTAAELYDNPELYFEMQSQLEGAHSGVPSGGDLLGAHAPTDVYTKFGNPATYQDNGLQYYEPGRNISPMPDTTAVEMLSPRQRSMLMNSMQDPLAMYTSSFAGTGESGLYSPELDPLEMYGVPTTSPVYGDIDVDYSDHPAFAMMNTGYPYKAHSPSPRKPGVF